MADEYWRVHRQGRYPRPRKHFYSVLFETREQAFNFCRDRIKEKRLTIVHPDGTQEPYEERNRHAQRETGRT
jgi:hypothetical protein